MMDEAAILATAVAIAHEAGAIVRQGFGRRHTVTMKGAVNPVTETDWASEQLIVVRLQAAFPGWPILAEEGLAETVWRQAERIWVVDPLDGTVNFAHGFPQLSVVLALVVRGEPIVGVTYDPLHEEIFTARRGGGAWCNGERISVSEVPDLDHGLLATGFPYDRRTAADNNVERLDHFLRRCQGVRRAGSAALDMAYVAAGRVDGYWEMRLNPWDVAAGIVQVREAGGTVTDFNGGMEMLANGTMVASNGRLHSEMLRVLREGAAAPRPEG